MIFFSLLHLEKEEAQKRAEEELQAKKRAERRAAKEKRKQEHKAIVEAQKHQANGSAAAQQKYVALPKPAAAPPKNKKTKPSKFMIYVLSFSVFLGT